MRDLTLHNKEQKAGIVADRNNSGGDNNLKNNKSVINCPTVLTGMSHEVRTHMNAIVAFSYLMNRNGCDESEREEFSNQILSSCSQLIGLFDNFLDTAILETSNQKADLKVCKLGNILDELLSEFREILRNEGQKDITLIAENGITNSPEVFIDINRVFRVLRNLFQNALNNTKTGYIKIGYYFGEDKVTFYVLDSGQGYFKCKEFLHTEDLNESLTIFNDTSSAINIALAKQLILLLSGTIWIESNGLSGSGIYFSIPAKVAGSSEINIDRYLNSMIAI